ncbi:MAG TPA: hypothetical protein VIV11_31810 [Kofleriaceae bacterium]
MPRRERDRIARRFERTLKRRISRDDDQPEAQEYADVLDEEIERIGRGDEQFSVRVLTKRFSDGTRDNVLAFRQLLDRAKLEDPERILQFFETTLQIQWIDPPARMRGRTRRR